MPKIKVEMAEMGGQECEVFPRYYCAVKGKKHNSATESGGGVEGRAGSCNPDSVGSFSADLHFVKPSRN